MKNKFYKWIIISISILVILLMIFVGLPHNKIYEDTLERYNKFFSLLSSISVTIGIVSVIFTYLLRKEDLKHNQFNVVNGLMTRYSKLLPDIVKVEDGVVTDDRELRLILLQYYNLSEEQLYYIGKGLIGKGIEEIWLTGIKQQIINFKNLENQHKTNNGEIIENFISDYIIDKDYPLLNLIYTNRSQEDIQTIKLLVINMVKEKSN